MAQDGGREVEAKLELSGSLYWRLRDWPALLGEGIEPAGRERLLNVYYDTPDAALLRAGALLRARKVEGETGAIWTLKTGAGVPAGVVVERGEMEARSPGAPRALPAAGCAPVEAARRLFGPSLRPTGAAWVERSLYRGPGLEVTLDRVRVPGDPVYVDYELEVEDRGAGREALATYVAGLARRLALAPSSGDKRSRLARYLAGQYGPPRLAASAALDEIARRIAALSVAAGRPLVVAICGASSSGKSYFTERLVERLAPANSPGELGIVHLDDWFGCLRPPVVLSPERHFDLPAAVDMAAACEAVDRLRRGLAATRPVYSFKESRRIGRAVLRPAKVLLVEGIWGSDPRLAPDLQVYLATSSHGQLVRRLARDVARTNQTASEVLEYFCRYAYPSHLRYREGDWVRADLIVLNDYDSQQEARRLPDVECQIKCRSGLGLADLLARGAQVVGEAEQLDEYLYPLDVPLDPRLEVVRFREVAGRTLFAYKGYSALAETGLRPRWEFPTDRACRDLLVELAYRRLVTLHKRRTVLAWKDCTLHLDEATLEATDGGRQTGNYLEIVAPDAPARRRLVAAARELDPESDWRVQSYPQMARTAGRIFGGPIA